MQEEILESLFCMDWKREGRWKDTNLGILSILGFLVLTAYIRYPSRFFLVILLIIIVLLLFYLRYGQERKRRRNACKIAKEKGEYRLEITDTFIRFGERQTKWMWQDLKIIFYISEHMYTLVANRQIFSIPKRILSEKEQKEILQTMCRQQARILNIQIKKELKLCKKN